MAKIKYEVILSDAAFAMPDAHAHFLAKVNKNAATELMSKILDDVSSLSNNPQRFPAYENEFIPDNRYRRMLSAKQYLVIYEIEGASVFVDYIVDCRQDYDWLIR